MNYAVAAAYGWNDLLNDENGRMKDEQEKNSSLQHDFHETKQGLRYTISETARREILDRLL